MDQQPHALHDAIELVRGQGVNDRRDFVQRTELISVGEINIDVELDFQLLGRSVQQDVMRRDGASQ
jgi:hypothetical protein